MNELNFEIRGLFHTFLKMSNADFEKIFSFGPLPYNIVKEGSRHQREGSNYSTRN